MRSSQLIDISSITIRSVIFLTILGSIAITDYVIFKSQGMSVNSTGAVINISGRQRMLTRQVGALIYLLYNAESDTEAEALKKQILNNIKRIETSHNALINGESDLGLPKLTSEAIQRIYFSAPYYLDITLREYLDHLKALIGTSKHHFTANNPHLHFVKTELQRGNILTGLDEVVKEHEYENKNQLIYVNVLKNIQVVFQIVLLFLSGIFLFYPLINKLRQQVDLLIECEENLKEAEYFAKAGHWVWNIAKKQLYWSDEIYRIFGCRPNENEESFDGLQSFVNSDDREILHTAVENLLIHNKPYNIEYGIVSQGGEEKIVQERGKATLDAHGKPVRLFGSISNITHIKQKEKMLTDLNKAYGRFVPLGFLRLLGKQDIKHVKLGDHIEKNMPILFSDIRNFTTISEQMTPEETFSFINSYLTMMEPIVISHHGIIDKYMGDAIMALFPMGIESAVRCAIAMQSELSVYNQENINQGLPLVKIGIGINSGKMTLGIVGGLHRMDSTVISDAVNLASRIEGLTKLYRSPLLISDSVYFSLSKIENLDVRFVDRVVAKGRSVPVSVYEVFSSDLPEIKEKKLKTRNIFEEALCLYHFKRISESQKLLEQCLKTNPDDNIAQIYLQRCMEFKERQVHQGVDDIGHIPQWDDALLIHVSQIDQQHKELFRRIGLLVEAVIQRKGSEQVVETLSFLENYTQKHFKDEEELMLQYEYPHYPRHKEAHTQFIESLNQLKKERNFLGSDSLHLLLRIHSQVINWLMTHIKYTDTKFAKFLIENEVTMD